MNCLPTPARFNVPNYRCRFVNPTQKESPADHQPAEDQQKCGLAERGLLTAPDGPRHPVTRQSRQSCLTTSDTDQLRGSASKISSKKRQDRPRSSLSATDLSAARERRPLRPSASAARGSRLSSSTLGSLPDDYAQFTASASQAIAAAEEPFGTWRVGLDQARRSSAWRARSRLPATTAWHDINFGENL